MASIVTRNSEHETGRARFPKSCASCAGEATRRGPADRNNAPTSRSSRTLTPPLRPVRLERPGWTAGADRGDPRPNGGPESSRRFVGVHHNQSLGRSRRDPFQSTYGDATWSQERRCRPNEVGQRPGRPGSRSMSVIFRPRCSWRQTNCSCAAARTRLASSHSVRHVGSAARSKHRYDPSPNCT